MAETTSQRPRLSWETRIALIEQRADQQDKRMDQQDQQMKDLSEKFDARFDALEGHVVELKNKNPIMDFIKEKWQAVTLVLVILLGQPSVDVLKLVVHVLFPNSGISG